MRIAIVTDAWEPQVNGVVRTMKATKAELERMGHNVLVVSPDLYPNLPCPTYPEIRLAMASAGSVGDRLAAFSPDAVHLSTEGPLCLAARRSCLRHGWRFTSAYHTQFPDYFAARTGIDAGWVWPYFRWFHAASSAVLVSTPSVRDGLRGHGIDHSVHWSRGVDLDAFVTEGDVGEREALFVRESEDGLELLLRIPRLGERTLDLEGAGLVFLGALSGAELAGSYAGSDVFVFPSRTDTFGLVMIEALASGTPVAAFPVSGPIDIVTPATGALDNDLDAAIAAALTRNRDDCAYYGRTFTWTASATQFVSALVPAIPPLARAA